MNSTSSDSDNVDLGLGGTAQGRDQKTVLRCIEWLVKHQQSVGAELWERAYHLALHGSERVQIRALKLIADRIDPVVNFVPVGNAPVNLAFVVNTSSPQAIDKPGVLELTSDNPPLRKAIDETAHDSTPGAGTPRDSRKPGHALGESHSE